MPLYCADARPARRKSLAYGSPRAYLFRRRLEPQRFGRNIGVKLDMTGHVSLMRVNGGTCQDDNHKADFDEMRTVLGRPGSCKTSPDRNGASTTISE